MDESGSPGTSYQLAQHPLELSHARGFGPAARIGAFVHGFGELLEQFPLPLGERARERGVKQIKESN